MNIIKCVKRLAKAMKSPAGVVARIYNLSTWEVEAGS